MLLHHFAHACLHIRGKLVAKDIQETCILFYGKLARTLAFLARLAFLVKSSALGKGASNLALQI